MKVSGIIAVLALLVLASPSWAEDIFDAPDQIIGKPALPPQSMKRPDAAPALGLVPGGNKATIVQSMESAISAIDAAMKDLASAGDTAGHDAVGRTRALLAATLEHVRSAPFLPSIYPLALNKKGCLFAVRETQMRAPGATGEPLKLKIQAVSWFKVKVVEAEPDGALRVDILDNTGAVLLYRAKLSGIQDSALKPGVTAQLVNTAFECLAEELDDAGSIYHLRKIPVESLLAPAK